MNRKLAVPLAFENPRQSRGRMRQRSRTLRSSNDSPEDLRMYLKLADNRVRLERLTEDIEHDFEIYEDDEFQTELDYINASIQLGLLEITGELEEIQSSEEILESATA